VWVGVASEGGGARCGAHLTLSHQGSSTRRWAHWCSLWGRAGRTNQKSPVRGRRESGWKNACGNNTRRSLLLPSSPAPDLDEFVGARVQAVVPVGGRREGVWASARLTRAGRPLANFFSLSYFQFLRPLPAPVNFWKRKMSVV